jgi:hypothetical protein
VAHHPGRVRHEDDLRGHGVREPRGDGQGTAKLQADEELRKLRKDLDTSGMREIVSDSLFEEITP